MGSRPPLIFGFSVGAAIPAEMAFPYESRAVLLESPCISIREMAQVILLALPIGPLRSAKFDVVGKLGTLIPPLLVPHRDQHEIVPFEQGSKGVRCAPRTQAISPNQGAGHNDTFIAVGNL